MLESFRETIESTTFHEIDHMSVFCVKCKEQDIHPGNYHENVFENVLYIFEFYKPLQLHSSLT